MFVQVLQNKELFIHLLSKKERTVLVQAFAYLAHLDTRCSSFLSCHVLELVDPE